jgi:hypothetical protein
MGVRIWPLALAIALAACASSPPANLSAQLRGIEKSKFLACSGPPQLDYMAAGQERMSLVTNLAHGAMIPVGIASPMPVESCSVDAVFEQGRLITATFGGNRAICDQVFAPCTTR